MNIQKKTDRLKLRCGNNLLIEKHTKKEQAAARIKRAVTSIGHCYNNTVNHYTINGELIPFQNNGTQQ
jgi:hypothetical protein